MLPTTCHRCGTAVGTDTSPRIMGPNQEAFCEACWRQRATAIAYAHLVGGQVQPEALAPLLGAALAAAHHAGVVEGLHMGYRPGHKPTDPGCMATNAYRDLVAKAIEAFGVDEVLGHGTYMTQRLARAHYAGVTGLEAFQAWAAQNPPPGEEDAHA